MNIRFPIDIYLDYLNDLDLIKNSSGAKNAYYKTIKGIVFIGFEKKVNEEKLVRNRDYKRTLIAVGLGAVLGWIPSLMQKDTILNPVVVPYIHTVHDKVYITKYLPRSDTSLVRIVKGK